MFFCRADVNATDNFMWTPLHHACYNGHLDIAKLIVKAGAAVDAPAMGNATPLMRAIEISRLDIVYFLLEEGADVQATNSNGKYQHPQNRPTSLHISMSYYKATNKTKFLECFEKCSEFMIAVRTRMKVKGTIGFLQYGITIVSSQLSRVLCF